MLTQIKGLHHITALASSAADTNAFFTKVLGQRRVKKTVNFDAPDVYHLYYGDELGTPGTVMTYFPFPRAARGKPGVGEVGTTSYAIPPGSAAAWADRLATFDVTSTTDTRFGEVRLLFAAPDGDQFALVETNDMRTPWTGNGVGTAMAIRGFHSAEIRLRDTGATADLLRFMGYVETAKAGTITRFATPNGTDATIIDLATLPTAAPAQSGAGSVHHIAFAVDNRARQLEVREALKDTGWQVTPVIDRDYFYAIYFRTPGGVLFEVATSEPGFTRDEDAADLGQALKLPGQHEHLRARLEKLLEPIGA